ncbi:Hypothetical predicted protein [Lecanosticta acicola]|uniref:Uncharacterized protein n=1 Tax=Lecanosticta acicola TaxID=111012 RepID=A0AAI8Z0W0_9PEZI|nr:Hypothetical predicted protein [Lecanosticta acicola]
MANTSSSPIPENWLTQLPSELLYNIFDYLFVRHQPDQLSYHLDRPPPCDHELDKLAATCRSLRNEINDWAIHFLLQHQDITRYKPPKQTVKKDKTFNALRGRGAQGLLSWTERHCIVCGKNTQCWATLVNGLKCCRPCDKIFWPNKITKTNACKEYDLKDFHLFPRLYAGTAQILALRAKFPRGIPTIRYGTRDSAGVVAKMLLREDVRWLAGLHHGDLDTHLENRRARLEERRRKMEENRKRKAAAEQTPAGKAKVGRGGSVISAAAGSTAGVPFFIDDDEDDQDYDGY